MPDTTVRLMGGPMDGCPAKLKPGQVEVTFEGLTLDGQGRARRTVHLYQRDSAGRFLFVSTTHYQEQSDA